MMTIRPILMSTSMVQAVMRQINLGSGKTQTRRVVTSGTTTWDGGAWPQHLRDYRFYNGNHSWIDYSLPGSQIIKSDPGGASHHIRPRIKVGDLLYVRETFCWGSEGEPGAKDFVIYRANHCDEGAKLLNPWKPSIHMPRSASRITLRVTDVWFEAIQDISESDILAEGIYDAYRYPMFPPRTWSQKADFYETPRDAFRALWDGINAEKGFGYDKNPYVVVIEFEPVRVNVDDFEVAR